jgi:hypothetical protein
MKKGWSVAILTRGELRLKTRIMLIGALPTDRGSDALLSASKGIPGEGVMDPDLWTKWLRSQPNYERPHQSLGCLTPQRSTGCPDDSGWWSGQERGIAGFWSEIGPSGVPRGLRLLRDYPGRGAGVKLERICSRPHQPGWDAPESREPGRGREQDAPWWPLR